MPEEQKLTPYSLCDDCPLNNGVTIVCKTATMPGIVLVCGTRAKYEASDAKE